MNFENLTNQRIRHAFVPADQMSITFVRADGFRRSLGIQNAGGTRIPFAAHSVPPSAEGGFISKVTYEAGKGLWLHLTEPVVDEITLDIPSGASLVELPE